jgi:hypothetical protein
VAQTLSNERSEAVTTLVQSAVADTPVYDIHTHLYDPAFGDLLLYGIDDLLVYHYLVSEGFRQFDLEYDQFWAMSKEQQADTIWDALFIQNSPISESCRGVLTTLNLLGLDVKKRDLKSVRKWFAEWNKADYTDHVMNIANVGTICMTNSPFDALERPIWEKGFTRHERFTSALRIDPLLLDWQQTSEAIAGWGYDVTPDLSDRTISGIRKFLADWSTKIDAKYLMVSLPPDFCYPGDSECARIMESAVLPHCRDFGLPFAMMPGVKRGVNPQLKMAGDGVAKACVSSFSHLIAAHPDNKFLVTALSRENQYELCVAARKFRNLHIFGCWWFTNIPFLINEITSMRMELLGLSFTPQHSDARVLDQIIYKWSHSRAIIGDVLAQKYVDLMKTGWEPTAEEIQRDVSNLFGGAFRKFSGSASSESATEKFFRAQQDETPVAS